MEIVATVILIAKESYYVISLKIYAIVKPEQIKNRPKENAAIKTQIVNLDSVILVAIIRIYVRICHR